jgi:hypothetical protein
LQRKHDSGREESEITRGGREEIAISEKTEKKRKVIVNFRKNFELL